MAIFPLIGQVSRVVTDVVYVDVEADSWEEAHTKAERVLNIFPGGHEVPGVPFCWLSHRANEAPMSIEINERIDEDSA